MFFLIFLMSLWKKRLSWTFFRSCAVPNTIHMTVYWTESSILCFAGGLNQMPCGPLSLRIVNMRDSVFYSWHLSPILGHKVLLNTGFWALNQTFCTVLFSFRPSSQPPLSSLTAMYWSSSWQKLPATGVFWWRRVWGHQDFKVKVSKETKQNKKPWQDWCLNLGVLISKSL